MNQGQYPKKKTAQGARHIYSETGNVNIPLHAKATITVSADNPKPTSAAQAPQPTKRAHRKQRPHGKLGKILEKIPYAAGIALCVVILCVSLLVGNARALSAAVDKAMDAWEVEDYVDGRVGEARNLLKLCERGDVSAELKTALESAIRQLDGAREDDVRAVIAGNQALETAASNVSAALLEGKLSQSDERSLSSTMDDFREQGNFLRQQARAYNDAAQEAVALYKKLPTQFLLPAPVKAAIE